MTLTQDASIGDTVIFVNCYVDGLQEGSTITLDGANYEVVALAEPSGRRRLANVDLDQQALLPVTLATALTSDVSSGVIVLPALPQTCAEIDALDQEVKDQLCNKPGQEIYRYGGCASTVDFCGSQVDLRCMWADDIETAVHGVGILAKQIISTTHVCLYETSFGGMPEKTHPCSLNTDYDIPASFQGTDAELLALQETVEIKIVAQSCGSTMVVRSPE